MWIVNYDGDDAGRMIGRAILSNQLNELHEASNRIKLGNEIVERWAMDHGGIIISDGGDQGAFEVPHEALDSLNQLMADYHFATRLTMSIGVGKTLSESGKSLLAAKFRGKNQIVFYDNSVDIDLQRVQSNLEQGTASEEERKQGEAYLKPQTQDMAVDNKYQTIKSENAITSNEHDCPYCQEMQSQNITDEDCPYCAPQAAAHDPNSPDHAADCPYCAVMNHDPGAADHAADCPYCAEMDKHDPSAEGHADDCPYCARSHDPNAEDHNADDCPYCARTGSAVGGDDQSINPDEPSSDILPTTQDSQNYAGQDMARPSMDKPAAISAQPSGIAAGTDSKTNQNIILEDTQGGPAAQEYSNGVTDPFPGDPQSNDTADNILAEIDAIPSNEVPLRGEGQTDAADLVSGTNMEDNVSRPDSYSQDVPTDLGLGEEPENGSPDLSSVLQEGLDNHADNIQRERVVEMVGQALEGFKASKMIIERAKTEAPQLYESSIAMLKAMIEMCKMLGLDQEQAASPSGVLEDAPAEDPNGPISQQADPNATIQGDPSVSDGHPDYNNLFPSHPDAGGGSVEGASNDPKLLRQ